MEILIALSKYLAHHRRINLMQCSLFVVGAVFLCWFLMVAINDWIDGHFNLNGIIDGGFVFGGLIVSAMCMILIICIRKYGHLRT